MFLLLKTTTPTMPGVTTWMTLFVFLSPSSKTTHVSSLRPYTWWVLLFLLKWVVSAFESFSHLVMFVGLFKSGTIEGHGSQSFACIIASAGAGNYIFIKSWNGIICCTASPSCVYQEIHIVFWFTYVRNDISLTAITLVIQPPTGHGTVSID